jgi:putative heme transporter
VGEARDDGDHDGGGRRRLPRRVKTVLKLLVLALVVEFLVLPQLAGARRALELISQVQPLLLLVGAVLQVGAYLAHAQLMRAVLPAGGRPALLDMARIGLAARAISHVVPGGTAAGTALTYRLLRQRGVSGADAGFASATQGIGAALVLNALLWLALLVSIPMRGFNPVYVTAAGLGVLLLGGFGVLVWLLLCKGPRAEQAAGAVLSRVPFVERATVERVVRRVAERVSELAADPPLLRRATGWALLHWLADAASFWVFLAAFGAVVPVDALLVAFGVGNVLAAIPITPRGLGVMEATLIAALVGFGVPRGEVVLGVVSYRLVNFWLPIPAGALAYLSLRLAPDRREEEPTEVLAGWVQDAQRQSESVREWAERHGIVPEEAEGR